MRWFLRLARLLLDIIYCSEPIQGRERERKRRKKKKKKEDQILPVIVGFCNRKLWALALHRSKSQLHPVLQKAAFFTQTKQKGNTSSTNKLREQWGRQGMAARAWEDFYSDKDDSAGAEWRTDCLVHIYLLDCVKVSVWVCVWTVNVYGPLKNAFEWMCVCVHICEKLWGCSHTRFNRVSPWTRPR